jgi:hypothetical protein
VAKPTAAYSDSSRAAPDAFLVTPPKLELPKGGGSIRGIGEKFSASPATGTGRLSIPLGLTSGRAGFGPALSLAYDSGAGNGPYGLGWRLPLPAISRKSDRGLPRYDDAEDSDVFLISDAEDLVPVLIENGAGWVQETLPSRFIGTDEYELRRYRPRIEGLFARIERWTRIDHGDVFWRSISRDNVTTYYGKTAESRIADPSDGTRIFQWLICESHDDKGNVILFDYAREDSRNVDAARANERNRSAATRSANRHLQRIRYGNTPPASRGISKSSLTTETGTIQSKRRTGGGASTRQPTRPYRRRCRGRFVAIPFRHIARGSRRVRIDCAGAS